MAFASRECLLVEGAKVIFKPLGRDYSTESIDFSFKNLSCLKDVDEFFIFSMVLLKGSLLLDICALREC